MNSIVFDLRPFKVKKCAKLLKKLEKDTSVPFKYYYDKADKYISFSFGTAYKLFSDDKKKTVKFSAFPADEKLVQLEPSKNTEDIDQSLIFEIPESLYSLNNLIYSSLK